MKNRKGFTIVELVIVIAVIAILAAVLIPTFSGVIQKANESSAQQEARTALSNSLSMSSNATLTNGTLFVIKNGNEYYYYAYNGNKLEEVEYDSSFSADKFDSAIVSNKATEEASNASIKDILKKVLGGDSVSIAAGNKKYTVTYGSATMDAAYSPDFSTTCVAFIGNGDYKWAEGKIVSTTTATTSEPASEETSN